MSMLHQISRAFAFGGIRHPELTPFLRRGPLIISAAITVIYYFLPIRPPLTGDGSLSRHMIAVFAIMPGFYIAALAAVATFNREETDYVMPDPAPELKLRTGAVYDYVKLTFRVFTSHLFAYLTSLSFIAVFIFVGAELLTPSFAFMAAKVSNTQASYIIRELGQVAYVALVAWFAAKIVLTTLIGLYFLAERMHRPNS